MQVESLAPFLVEIGEQFVKASPPKVLPFILLALPLHKCHLQIWPDENFGGASLKSGASCPLLSFFLTPFGCTLIVFSMEFGV